MGHQTLSEQMERKDKREGEREGLWEVKITDSPKLYQETHGVSLAYKRTFIDWHILEELHTPNLTTLCRMQTSLKRLQRRSFFLGC